MTWKVAFEKISDIGAFRDVSDYNVEVDYALIEAVSKLVKKGKGKAISHGIIKVSNPSKKEIIGSEHFILSVKRAKKIHSMLFKLKEEETSKLMGVSSSVKDKNELLSTIYSILSENIDDIKLLI